MALIIRRATIEDAEAIARVDLDSHIAVYRPLRGDAYLADATPESATEHWHRLLSSPASNVEVPREVLVAEDHRGVLGYSALGASRDAGAGAVGEVFSIYLHPSVWRRGIGSRLLKAATDRLHEFGYTEITLWVLDANEAARAFYAAQGWQPDGATEQSRGAPGINLRYRAPPHTAD